MADDLDRAQGLNEDFQAFVLDRQLKDREPANYTGHDCVSCGEEIPQARRNAVPGCCRCISCQEKHEKADRELLAHWRQP